MKVVKLLFLLTVLSAALYGQTIDMKAVEAEDNLRWGVIAFNNGFYNKAVQSLEKALALKPENPVILAWLGRSYYMSGLEDAALAEWEKIISTGEAGASLINLSELIKYRQLLSIQPRQEEKWVVHMELESQLGGFTLFDRPTAAVPTRDGSGGMFIVSFATNQVLHYDANGALKETLDGGFEGYDHPFDIFPLRDGRFLLSEFTGNSVSLCGAGGSRILKIGDKGIGEGQLLGPQYLASDEKKYFYVTDAGNRKIVKYDFEGNFVLEIGKTVNGFPGFQWLTGIVLDNEKIYAADSVAGSIYVFDDSGNYLETLVEGKLDRPEGLSLYNNDLLIADGPLIRRYDRSMEHLSLLIDRTGNSLRSMDGELDENGNLLVADYDANRIAVLTELSSVYGGLFVRINRINADRFPEIIVDFSVERRDGRAVVGLDKGNFIITEKSRPVNGYSLEFKGFSGTDSYLTILVDGSEQMAPYGDSVTGLLKEIYSSETGSVKSLISIGETPYIVSSFNDRSISDAIEEATSQWSPLWSADTGIRLAASQMIPGRDRRSVLFITQGDLPASAFDRYDVIDLAAYYKNNNIVFNTVYTVPGRRNRELEYLAGATGGQSIYMFRPGGIRPLLEDMEYTPSAIYTASYSSNSNPDFGRAYIPVELEVLYVNKSGRDESGYYPPIQ
ncbi:MAG: tetratricopeptide repeat protein [Spirochaetales bacterium]|nr:tetratricopeptide repeat protein [Spirochaetales bacterium]